jgi:HTH-type transcriptional regulator/antitoxin HigA
MNALAHKIDEQLVDHFRHVLPYIKVPTSESENQKLIKRARELKAMAKAHETHAIKELLNLIYKNIDAYERRIYPVEHSSPADILAFLMEQHDLTQSDLPEIGTQSHVSKILNGERNLTREQIGLLSKRFGVSPAVFYD